MMPAATMATRLFVTFEALNVIAGALSLCSFPIAFSTEALY
jgi:hypothetical protein